MMRTISTTAVIAFWLAIISVPRGSSGEELPDVANSSCPTYQTPCTFGCCPFAEGVCCADGFECCQHGQSCIPFIGVCLGLRKGDNGGDPSLFSRPSTPVIGDCPPGTTDCGDDKCCRWPHATCCSDGIHCCPHGFRCDLARKVCVRQSPASISRARVYLFGGGDRPLAKSIEKSARETPIECARRHDGC